jgi:hypothetical protein
MKPQKQGRNRRGQFEPGVSGNPGGRPRGRASIVAEMRLIAETEYRKGETFAQRIARLVIVGAAGGDARMIALAIDRLDGKPTPEPPPPEEVEIVEIERIEPSV